MSEGRNPTSGIRRTVKLILRGMNDWRCFSILTSGQAITTPDGKIVQPTDAMEPMRPGTGVAVCDLPDTTYVKDFLAREEWGNNKKVRAEVGCFFLILGLGVSVD